MTFTVDGVDFSGKVEVTGYRIKPRKVFGSSRGDLLNGGHISDFFVLKKCIVPSFCSFVEAGCSTISAQCCPYYFTMSFSVVSSGLHAS